MLASLPGPALAVQKEIFGLQSGSDGNSHILRFDVVAGTFQDTGVLATGPTATTNLAMDANRRLYYMHPFDPNLVIWQADLDSGNNLINQQVHDTLTPGLNIIDGFTIGPNQDLYMTGYGHSEIYRYVIGSNSGTVTTEVTLTAGGQGGGEYRSDLAFDPLTGYLVGIGIVPGPLGSSGPRSLFQIPGPLAANGLNDNLPWEFFGGNSSPWASIDLRNFLGGNPDGVAFDPTNGDLYLSGDGEKFSLWDRSNATVTSYLVSSGGQDTGMGFDLAFQQRSAVPEPGTLLPFALGLVGLLGFVRRRRRPGSPSA